MMDDGWMTGRGRHGRERERGLANTEERERERERERQVPVSKLRTVPSLVHSKPLETERERGSKKKAHKTG